jgi:hypothetical protein
MANLGLLATFGETGSFGGLAPFFGLDEGRKNRVITEEMSFHFPCCGSHTLHFTKCGQEPNLGRNGGLLPILQPFAALYVLMLALLGPLLTMQSRFVFEQLNRIFRWRRPPEKKEGPPRVDGTP